LSGVLVLFGWAFDVGVLKSVLPGLPPMVPSTALCFALCGVSLLLLTTEPPVGQPPQREWGARTLATAAMLIGLLRLAEIFTGVEFGINRVLVDAFATTGNAPQGQMALATATCFVAAGAALLLAQSSRHIAIFQALLLLVAAIAWLSLGRYLYGGEPLLPIAATAMHTALLLFVLSVGILSVRRNGGLVSILLSDSEGGATARRLLPAALVLPLFFGWLRLLGQQAGWYGTEAGLLLFAMTNVAVFGSLVWINAALLHRSDTNRRNAERKTAEQFERLDLLRQITRAIGERQDIGSIFQVAIRSIEEQLPADFAAVLLRDATSGFLTVTAIGTKGTAVAMDLALPERTRFAADENGLSRCLRGDLVYEPDVGRVPFSLPQRLAAGGLRALVVAPLATEGQVFGVLLAARVQPESFSSGECDFLRQISEHVALASHQAQLHDALQQAYDDLRRSQQTMMQQERLKALVQMASGIAHDINNAVSPVSLYTQSLLETEPNLSTRARSYLETIERAIDDVAHTVARMREFYRQREPQLTLTSVNVNEVVAQTVEFTRARWSDIPQRQGVVIEMRLLCATDVPAIMGSESEIREALVNLVFNAVDAMPNGGTLTLQTCFVDDRDGANSTSSEAGACVQIAITDTGVGMDEDTRSRCLEPFFTTKGERGTGLGLAMVYGIIQRHSADLEIESAPGKGTTVRLKFGAATAHRVEPNQRDAESAPRLRLRILAVDDDPLLLKSLGDTLAVDGHTIVTASGGRAAIDAFRDALQRDDGFDAVITDLGMPHVDGRQVAKAVKAASRSTPVIMLTGWGQKLIADGDLPEHVDCVLSKPPKLRELRRALTEYIYGNSVDD
jgi:signal transduction histidine kinase/ActR/RegA family two-component response regulator